MLTVLRFHQAQHSSCHLTQDAWWQAVHRHLAHPAYDPLTCWLTAAHCHLPFLCASPPPKQAETLAPTSPTQSLWGCQGYIYTLLLNISQTLQAQQTPTKHTVFLSGHCMHGLGQWQHCSSKKTLQSFWMSLPPPSHANINCHHFLSILCLKNLLNVFSYPYLQGHCLVNPSSPAQDNDPWHLLKLPMPLFLKQKHTSSCTQPSPEGLIFN